jgi:hypothetical protein
MFKKIALLLSLTLVFSNFVGCTSSDPVDDTELAENSTELDVSEDRESVQGDGELDVADDNSEESLDVAQSEESSAQNQAEAPEGTLPEEALGDSELSLDEEIAASEASVEDGSQAPSEAVASSQSAPPSDTAPELGASEEPKDLFAEAAPIEPQEASSTESASSELAHEEKPAFSAPLQKVPVSPWRQGGVLYNSVYFAKPSETLKSISKKIYGDSSKVSELRKGNGIFASRGVLPGDKVYYSSPTRPMDDSRVMSYYEEKGLIPQVYIAQEGDRLRPVSEKLLGYSAGWKEIWSSNNFDSKSDLAAGTEIRYFKEDGGTASSTQVLAGNGGSQFDSQQLPPPTPTELPPPTAMAENEFTPPPPPQDIQQPPPPELATADIAPPPPPVDIPPPPPPGDIPPPPSKASLDQEAGPRGQDMAGNGVSNGVSMENNMDNHLMAPFYEDPMVALAIAAGGLLLLGVIMISARKRRHQKELEQALSQHNAV